jgi:type III secretion protein U
MAEKNDGGDKTEKPTAKRLRDARKKGEVSKSKDVTSVVVLLAWAALGVVLCPMLVASFTEPLQLAVELVRRPSNYAMVSVGSASLRALVVVVLSLLGPVAAIGLLTEFAQAGPVLTLERMKFKLDHLNPAEGLKRMFSADNLFEVAKSLLKALLIVGLLWLVVASRFSDMTSLARGGPDGLLSAMGAMLRELFIEVAMVFVLVAGTDAAYQRFSFTKKMRMSRRDIRQELKDSEGDPYIRRQRKQLHQEWAGRTAVEAARSAAALVVNPTHIAIALDYDPELHPAPMVAAKGLGALAADMREAAESEGVPVVRNVQVARTLNVRGVVNDVVPQDMFAAVAEVIVWARRMREETEAKRREEPIQP